MAIRRFRKTAPAKRKAYNRKTKSMVPWYAKRYSIGEMASKALQGVSYIKGLVNSELYKLDFGTNFTVGTAGAVTYLTNVSQGDGVAARTGNSILAKSVLINFNVINNASATNGTVIRYWVIMDTQQVGDTNPAFADVFSGNDVNSTLNVNTVGRFRILETRTFILSPGDRPTIQKKIYLPLQHHVRFNGTAGTDVQKGGLYWMMCSNQATNTATCNYTCRFSYHDN